MEEYMKDIPQGREVVYEVQMCDDAFVAIVRTGYNATLEEHNKLMGVAALNANLKAKTLFLNALTKEQIDSFIKDNFINVVGSLGGRYMLFCGGSTGAPAINIYKAAPRNKDLYEDCSPAVDIIINKMIKDNWRWVVRNCDDNSERKYVKLCANIGGHMCPKYDHILAQKLWIETAEDEFVRMCNIWGPYDYRDRDWLKWLFE
jgi:hypothetical protein